MSVFLDVFQLIKGVDLSAVRLWLVVWSKHCEIWKPYWHLHLLSRYTILCRS